MLTQSDASSEKADVLVNNAGIMQLAKISDADDGFFDRHIAINLKGVFNGMREAAKRLRGGGRIISFSSSVQLTVCLHIWWGSIAHRQSPRKTLRVYHSFADGTRLASHQAKLLGETLCWVVIRPGRVNRGAARHVYVHIQDDLQCAV
jgi:NAD(P)-dependent dehydrogenase (short-subunit alcohol dehydrogenase family)